MRQRQKWEKEKERMERKEVGIFRSTAAAAAPLLVTSTLLSK